MIYLFEDIEDISCEGESLQARNIALQIEELSEDAKFALLRWLIAQLLMSEDLKDEALILLDDVIIENNPIE